MNKKTNTPSYFEKTFGKKQNNAEKKASLEQEEGSKKKTRFEHKDHGERKRPHRGADPTNGKEGFDRPTKFKDHKSDSPFPKKKQYSTEEKKEYTPQQKNTAPALAANEKMPLNKYIAHCGLCSRRDAVLLIKQGKVKINDELITEPGHKIEQGDVVSVSGKKITPQKNLAYILLNKPKGFITTTDDEKGRRTIMDLVSVSEDLRLFPVGRLDRATTGLILLTNDGDLAQKLSHPKFKVKKVYHVTLDKNISSSDYDKIVSGLQLEDGWVQVDALSILENKNELGIQIHSGKNRIVRRIFEHLGYVVEKLDRVVYAGLTKKNLPRGKWRELTAHEVVLLKHFKS